MVFSVSVSFNNISKVICSEPVTPRFSNNITASMTWNEYKANVILIDS